MQESNQNDNRDNRDGQWADHNSGQGTDGYQYRPSGSYTTPNGRSGYSYTPDRGQGNAPQNGGGHGKNGGRTFVIALCVILAVIFLLGTVCYMSISTIARWRDYHEKNNVGESDQTSSERSDTTTDGTGKSFPTHVVIDKSDSIKTNGIKEVTSAGNSNYSLAQVVSMVKDSVVEISTEKVVNSAWYGQYVLSGAGSGVIISANDGCVIVTNYHVISGANTITVKLTDGSSYIASVRGYDAVSDLAVLYIDSGNKDLTSAQLGCSADLVVGEDVIAIGNPLGSLGGTVTNGIISATERQIYIDGIGMTLLQTNAAISPGNSGGGLFNKAGQLIGIVNAKSSDSEAEGLGFAIPIDHAYEIIEELIKYGTVRSTVDAGLTLVDKSVKNDAYRTFGNPNAGVFVYESAYSEDLKYGDRIVSVDGSSIASSDVFSSILRQKKPGDTIQIVVERLSKSGVYATLKQVKVTLTLRAPSEETENN